VTTDALASYSLIAVYSAMAVYLFAFIAFTLDLAQRSALTTAHAVVARPAALIGKL